MAKIFSDFSSRKHSKWHTYNRSLGAVKLKEDEEIPFLQTCTVRLGEFSIRSTEILWNKNLQIRNSPSIKFQLKLTIFDFYGYFWSKKGRMENHHRILHIRISLGSKFTWTNNFDFVEQICPKKGIFGQKWRKWKTPMNFTYLIGKKSVGKMWRIFVLVTNIFYRRIFLTDK